MSNTPKIQDDSVAAPVGVRAAWLADGRGACFAPGVLVLRGRTVVAAGSPESVGVPGGLVTWVDASDSAVIPALVNAHTHLDLTLVPRIPEPKHFFQWLGGVRSARLSMTADDVRQSVIAGVQRLDAGGVAAVGDIAGTHALQASLAACTAMGLDGCVFEEVFGMGPRVPASLAALEAVTPAAASGHAGRIRRGVQPHAPYSCDRRVFEAALRSGLPVSTHLAESVDERRFLADGSGPFRDLLESFGLWDGTFSAGARHPIDWMAERLRAALAGPAGRQTRVLCAHLNDIDDQALALLATLPIDVAYCPRASEFFGHVGHRYRAMRAAGVNVCLGTDSALNLDTPDRISTVDDLRLLMRRDQLPLSDALEMATVAGARALGLEPSRWDFSLSPVAGVIAVALGEHRAPADFGKTGTAPRWLCRPEMS
jgi:cytosine/adenosine deaminase-related metal-dependent hydrolase